MTNVSQDFAPGSLIRAIEANTIESFKTWSKWKKMELHQDVDGMRITTDIPFFIFNLVFPSKNSLTEPGYLIDAAISRARSRRLPMGWWVGPSNLIPDMGQRLEAKGLFHAATLTGMSMDLNNLEASAPVPNGLTISEVDNDDALETWCRIMTSVSEFPDFAAAAWLEMYQDMEIIDDPLWHLYLGSFDGNAVSTSALFLGAGVAGIHGVTTLPEFRGLGIGHAMTHFPLVDGRSQGYRIGVLFSSEMASNIYRRMGFQEYSQGNIYMWQTP